MSENRDNRIWIVEWTYQKESYRISRWSDPCRAVAYDDYWEDAIWKGIDRTYPEWEVILVRDKSGNVGYAVNPFKFMEVDDGSNEKE